MLRGRTWEHVTRGVYAPTGSLHGVRARATAFARVLPRDTGYGHVTRAALRGWWLPWLPADLPLLATTRSNVHVQRPGLYVRRSSLATLIGGDVPLVSTPDALVEASQDLALIDLVALVDAALHLGDCTADELTGVARQRRGGARRLRVALTFSDPCAESRWESVLRLVHDLSGIAVDAQSPVRADDGILVARADLRIRGTDRLVEYDGATHRGARRHRRDLARDKALLRLGLERYGYCAPEIVGRPDRIIRDAEQALGLPHDPRRLDRWRREFRASSPSEAGRAALRRRLERFGRPGSARHRSVRGDDWRNAAVG